MKLLLLRNTRIMKGITHILIAVASILTAPPWLSAQGLYNNGATMVVSGGTWVYLDGGANANYRNESMGSNHGSLDIDGSVVLEGDWTNNATSGNVLINRDNDGWVRFVGSTAQNYNGTADTRFEYLEIDNSVAGNAVNLNRDAIVEGECELNDGVVRTSGNYLILESTTAADLSGHSANSFVNGNLRRYVATNTSTYAFPVGDGSATTDYYLAELTNNNMTGVNYINGSFGALTAGGILVVTELGTPYDDVCTDGVWYLNPNVQPTGGSYHLLGYTTNFTCGLVDNQFALVKRPTASVDAADWVCTPCGIGAAGLNAAGGAGRILASGYALRKGYTSFSQFGIARSLAVLPVEWLDFTAACIDESFVIEWSTATETNNDYFTIERSDNGTNFEIIATIPGAGTTSNTNSYAYTDVSAHNKLYYYRISQTDYNGAVDYTEIIPVAPCELREFEVAVSAVGDDYFELTVISESTEQVKLTVYDVRGRELTLETLNLPDGYQRINVNTRNTATGIYVVALHSKTASVSKKIWIN